MKKYEYSFLWEKHWALGFWIMPQWFGMQIANFKIVISKKCKPIEPIEFPKYLRENQEWMNAPLGMPEDINPKYEQALADGQIEFKDDKPHPPTS